MLFQNLAFIFPSFDWFLPKNVVRLAQSDFIKTEAVLLCVTMWECGARAFAATI